MANEKYNTLRTAGAPGCNKVVYGSIMGPVIQTPATKVVERLNVVHFEKNNEGGLSL